MQYLILIYDEEKKWADMPKADAEKMFGEYRQCTQDLVKSGVLKGGAQLQPVANATTLRSRGGKLVTTDGPFAETKEQLGGFYLIDVPDLDSALKWASKVPSVRVGSIEVRAVVHNPGT